MSSGKVKCTCGWSWNKSDSSKKDMYICHECGRDNSNNMKNGGWLDNYNDSQASAPEGFQGDGYSNVGRNYSPAWGGQFQMGGYVYPVNYVPQAQEGKELTFLQPTSDKLPEGYRFPYSDPSTERAMSIGGENGEPAYLIPSFKYGKPLYSPIEEFRKTGEHLGGPFKTYQEADQWENETRHPAVERGEDIMFPQEKFQMGGTIAGAVGFSYARTQGAAPSNGKYAKKTMASAQNGDWLENWKEDHPSARSMRNDAMNRKIEESKGKGKETVVTKKDNTRTVAPKEIKKLSGKQQNELAQKQSEEQARKDWVQGSMEEAYKSPLMSPGYFTPEGAAIGALQGATKMGPDLYEGDYKAAAMDALMMLPLAPSAIKTATPLMQKVGRALGTEEGLLSNAYKLNPKSYQRNLPENTMWRGLGKEGMEDAVNSGLFRSKQNVPAEFFPGSTLRMHKSFGTNPYFTPRFETASTYGDNFLAEVPKDVANWRNRYARSDWSQIADRPIPINEGRLLQKDWWQGYKEVPKQNNVQPSFIKQDLSEGNNIKYSFTDKQGNNIGTFSGTKSPKGIYVNGIEVNPEFRRQGVASDIYKNIARELQSKNEGTLFSRSGQHQFTAKDELGRSVAPANKLWENLVNKGEAEKFVEGMSHSYKMKPLKQGGIIKDDRGQWDYPGKITRIKGRNITMKSDPKTGKALTQPILGIANTGERKIMYPGQDYQFAEGTEYVTEIPKGKIAQNGLRQEQKGLQNLDNLTNFTNYNTKQPGGWLDTL